MSKRPRQLSLDLRTHGGKRRGAGRKPKGEKPLVSHRARPRFHRATPVHVTMKLRPEVPNLRSSRRFKVVRRCFEASRALHGVRLVEFAVLSNHLHLIVEADDSVALSRGIQGLAVRLARGLNRLLARVGKVFADHFHSHLLSTPTEVARSIRYVLTNAVHHYGEPGLDVFSSAAVDSRPWLAAATCWLLLQGRQYSRAPRRDVGTTE
jgi:putative transposase